MILAPQTEASPGPIVDILNCARRDPPTGCRVTNSATKRPPFTLRFTRLHAHYLSARGTFKRKILGRPVGRLTALDVTPRSRSPRWSPWAGAILLVIFVNVSFLGFQRGECFDYTIESGATSTCTGGPALGIAGSWTLAIVSLAAIVYFTGRLMQIVRARKD